MENHNSTCKSGIKQNIPENFPNAWVNVNVCCCLQKHDMWLPLRTNVAEYPDQLHSSHANIFIVIVQSLGSFLVQMNIQCLTSFMKIELKSRTNKQAKIDLLSCGISQCLVLLCTCKCISCHICYRSVRRPKGSNNMVMAQRNHCASVY